jgi:hypothetical protein
MLSDIFRTGYHGTVLGEVGPGHRLGLAESIGAEPIDRSAGDPVEQITDAKRGHGRPRRRGRRLPGP